MSLQISSLHMSLNWPVVLLGLLIVLRADGALAPTRAQPIGNGNGNGNGNVGNFNGNFNQGNGNGNGNSGNHNGNSNAGNGHGNCNIGNGFGNNDRSGSYTMNMRELNALLRCQMQQRRTRQAPGRGHGGDRGLGWFSGTDMGDRS
ncbi:MAG: hypothetical protein KGQ46_08935 [Hyphomicrobiales bacterium]|nr:hypothetical protein [Hyphomicrobiales bacterium]MDE2113402.1 hypothetical protein [Hyphomicrobiales bacterium]